MNRDQVYEVYLEDMNYSVAGGALAVSSVLFAALALGARSVFRRFNRKV